MPILRSQMTGERMILAMQNSWLFKLESKTSALSNPQCLSTTTGNNDKKSFKAPTNLDPRRMKNQGPALKIDGVQYWWCPKHVLKGVFDGLYMPHRPGKEHDEWAAAKKKRQEEYKKKNQARKQARNDNNSERGGDGNSKNEGNKKSFVLSDKLKAALCTQGQLTPQQLETIVNNKDFQ